jgi:hypothetical protein
MFGDVNPAATVTNLDQVLWRMTALERGKMRGDFAKQVWA